MGNLDELEVQKKVRLLNNHNNAIKASLSLVRYGQYWGLKFFFWQMPAPEISIEKSTEERKLLAKAKLLCHFFGFHTRTVSNESNIGSLIRFPSYKFCEISIESMTNIKPIDSFKSQAGN